MVIKLNLRLIGFFSAIVLPLLVTACAKPLPAQAEFVLGTVCTVNLFGGGDRQTYARIFSRLREIDRTMTAHPGELQELFATGANGETHPAADTLISGVIAINEQAGIAPVKVRADLIALLETALRYAALSDGAFDPSAGPLIQLWGIGTDTERIPNDEEIAAALELVNWRDVEIDREAGTVFLRRKGMSLDLGGIAKGYAGDEASRIFAERKFARAIFDLGGNIIALGYRGKQGEALLPWRIGIQDPFDMRGTSIGMVPVHDQSVVTSGVYERYFESGGQRYHHILSTATGRPVANGLLSVTIVAGSSTDADALSTVIFTLGYEKGKALIDTLPNAEAIFVFEDRTVKITDGLEDKFTLTNNEFTLIQ